MLYDNKEFGVKNELIKLANHLDGKGLHTEADYLDALTKRAYMPAALAEGISEVVNRALGDSGKSVGEIITELLEVSKQGSPEDIKNIIKDLDAEKLRSIISELLLNVWKGRMF